MKKKFFFLPFLAAMTLAGCSSNDEPENSGSANGNGNGNGKESYIAVRILAPGGAGMGRGTDGGFEAATDVIENTVNRAVFLFFDEYGHSTQSPQEVDLKFNDPAAGDQESIEKISDVTVVLTGNDTPTQLLCVLNPRDGFIKNNSGRSLSDVIKQENAYHASSKGFPYGEAGQFVMSNSTYVDSEDNIICATPINPKTQTFETVEAAQAASGDQIVQVYAERVVAKVVTSPKEKDGITVNNSDVRIYGKTGGGSDVTLVPVIHGIRIANIAQYSYLYKHVDKNWSTQWTGTSHWNDATNHRSYWATTPATNYLNMSWNVIGGFASAAALADPTVAPLAASAENAQNNEYFKPNVTNTFYISENTGSQKSSVLITATLKMKDSNGNLSSAGETFVYWGGGYYTKDAILSQYAAQLANAGVRVKYYDDDAYTPKYKTIDPDNGTGPAPRSRNFQWLTDEEHSRLVNAKQLKEYETTVTCTYELQTNVIEGISYKESFVKLVPDAKESSGFKEVTITINEIDEILRQPKNRCWIWNEGRCYYFAEIEHFGPKVSNADFSIGVVRNHVYNITLESLSGLGTPVYDPDVDIVPEKPDDDLFYIAAKVNILKWKVVSQTVNFK